MYACGLSIFVFHSEGDLDRTSLAMPHLNRMAEIRLFHGEAYPRPSFDCWRSYQKLWLNFSPFFRFMVITYVMFLSELNYTTCVGFFFLPFPYSCFRLLNLLTMSIFTHRSPLHLHTSTHYLHRLQHKVLLSHRSVEHQHDVGSDVPTSESRTTRL